MCAVIFGISRARICMGRVVRASALFLCIGYLFWRALSLDGPKEAHRHGKMTIDSRDVHCGIWPEPKRMVWPG